MCLPEGEEEVLSLAWVYVWTNSSSETVAPLAEEGVCWARLASILIVSGSVSVGIFSGKSPCSSCWAAAVSPVRPSRSASGPDPKGVCWAWFYFNVFTLQTSRAILVGFVTERQGPCHDLGSLGSPNIIRLSPFPFVPLRRTPSFQYIFLRFSLLMSCLSCFSTRSSLTEDMDGWLSNGEHCRTIASARLSSYPSLNCWCWACRVLKVRDAPRLRASISDGVRDWVSSTPPSTLYCSSCFEETGKFLLCLNRRSQYRRHCTACFKGGDQLYLVETRRPAFFSDCNMDAVTTLSNASYSSVWEAVHWSAWTVLTKASSLGKTLW